MSAQVHGKLPTALPYQRARAKAIKTHLRRVGIAVALVLAALIVTSFLPSGVHASTPTSTHAATHGTAAPPRLVVPARSPVRSAPLHVR